MTTAPSNHLAGKIPEQDVIDATLASLRASVNAMFTAAATTHIALNGGMNISEITRAECCNSAYDSVIDLLPAHSPFRAPLLAFRDHDVRRIATKPVEGSIFLPVEPTKR